MTGRLGNFRELTDEERERPGTLFGTHLRPMGLNVLGYQSHLGIVAILPVPRRILLKVIAYVPYLNETIRRCQPSNGRLYGLLVKCKGIERQKGKSTPLFVEALQMSKRRETHDVWVKRCVGEERLPWR